MRPSIAPRVQRRRRTGTQSKCVSQGDVRPGCNHRIIGHGNGSTSKRGTVPSHHRSCVNCRSSSIAVGTIEGERSRSGLDQGSIAGDLAARRDGFARSLLQSQRGGVGDCAEDDVSRSGIECLVGGRVETERDGLLSR